MPTCENGPAIMETDRLATPTFRPQCPDPGALPGTGYSGLLG
jgi:hypothetical protein